MRTSSEDGPSRFSDAPQPVEPHRGTARNREVIARRPEVVVDDVEDHGQPPDVTGVDEAGEGIRAAVRFVHRIPADAVVAPVVLTVEGVERHDLHRIDAELHQVVEVPDGRVEGPLGGEGADVELVEHGTADVATGPLRVVPDRRVDHMERGEAVDAVGQTYRPRVGQRALLVVDEESVPQALGIGVSEFAERRGQYGRVDPVPPGCVGADHRQIMRAGRSDDPGAHPCRRGRPDPEVGHAARRSEGSRVDSVGTIPVFLLTLDA